LAPWTTASIWPGTALWFWTAGLGRVAARWHSSGQSSTAQLLTAHPQILQLLILLSPQILQVGGCRALAPWTTGLPYGREPRVGSGRQGLGSTVRGASNQNYACPSAVFATRVAESTDLWSQPEGPHGTLVRRDPEAPRRTLGCRRRLAGDFRRRLGLRPRSQGGRGWGGVGGATRPFGGGLLEFCLCARFCPTLPSTSEWLEYPYRGGTPL